MQSRRSEGHRFQWQHSALWPPSSFIVMTVNSISSRSSLCIMLSSSCAVSCGCTLRQCSVGRHMLSIMLHMKQHAALSISFLCSTNSMAQLAATEAGTLSVVQDLFRSSRTEVLFTGLRFIFNLSCVLSADTPNKSFSEPAAGCYV